MTYYEEELLERVQELENELYDYRRTLNIIYEDVEEIEETLNEIDINNFDDYIHNVNTLLKNIKEQLEE